MSAGDAEHELIDAAKSGDRAALGQLLLSHYNRLSLHIAPRLPAAIQSVISVDDILQETFVQAFRDVSRFEWRSDGSFFAWLKTLAEHRLQDTVKGLFRKKRGGQRHRVQRPTSSTASSAADLVDMLSDAGHTASQSLARRDVVQEVQVALASLANDYREVIRLRYLEGKSLKETADAMGRSPEAVRSLTDRAKKKLRDALGSASRFLSTKLL